MSKEIAVLRTDQELIDLFQHGQQEAFDELVRRYERPIRTLCRYYLSHPQDVQDASQDAFVRVYQALGTFEPRAQFSTWLYRIAINQCLNAIRAQRRRRWMQPFSQLRDSEEEPEFAAVGTKDPLQEVEQKERIQHVREALARLPEEQRAVVILHRYQGLSYQEIAETLGISLAAVESRLHRAKLKLANLLAPYIRGAER